MLEQFSRHSCYSRGKCNLDFVVSLTRSFDVMAATRTTRKNRGPAVLKDLPSGNWYRSELKDELNELNIAFSSKEKVTSLIKKLEQARFHPSSLLWDPQSQEENSSQQRTVRFDSTEPGPTWRGLNDDSRVVDVHFQPRTRSRSRLTRKRSPSRRRTVPNIRQ